MARRGREKRRQFTSREFADRIGGGAVWALFVIIPLKNGLNAANKNINKIFERLPLPKTVDASSPLKLTEFGRRISNEVDARMWTENQVNNLLDEVEGKEEFEIFEACVEYIENIVTVDKELERKINATAYDKGTEKEQILMIYRIELRDQILAKLNSTS